MQTLEITEHACDEKREVETCSRTYVIFHVNLQISYSDAFESVGLGNGDEQENTKRNPFLRIKCSGQGLKSAAGTDAGRETERVRKRERE